MKLFVEENESLNGRSCGRVCAVFPAPQMVYGAYDDADGAGIVALIDLNESGHFPLSHYSGMNLSQLLSVAEKVAEFHAVGSAMMLGAGNDNGVASSSSADDSDSVGTNTGGLTSLLLSRPKVDSQFLYDQLAPFYKDLAKFLRRVPGYSFCYSTLCREMANLVSYYRCS